MNLHKNTQCTLSYIKIQCTDSNTAGDLTYQRQVNITITSANYVLCLNLKYFKVTDPLLSYLHICNNLHICILWLRESSITAFWCTSIPYILLTHHHNHLRFMFYTAPPSCPPMSHTTLITGFVISVIQGNLWKTNLLYSFQMVAPVDFEFCDFIF